MANGRRLGAEEYFIYTSRAATVCAAKAWTAAALATFAVVGVAAVATDEWTWARAAILTAGAVAATAAAKRSCRLIARA